MVLDWFALLNNKMGGDLKKIKIVGEYMIEVFLLADCEKFIFFKVWKACGMDMDHVKFVWTSGMQCALILFFKNKR